MKLARAWLGGVLLTLLVACGDGPPPRLAWYGRPIIGGDYDSNPDHAAVVAIMDNYGLCTGTLISPDVILTAAHCAQSPASRYTIYFGSSLYNSTRRAISDRLPHPQYDDNSLVNDIALMRLVAPAPAYVTPIANLPGRLGISILDRGVDLEFVGFGEDERGNAGVKLTVHNQLDWVCTSVGGCTVGSGYYAAANTICQDQNPGGPCSGDSGGPALLVREGREYVAGITSYGDEQCRYYGCSTKVDEFEQFIVDYVGGELGAPCSSPDSCNSGHCVDGVCCESECQGECQGCNVGGQWGRCATLPDGASCADDNLCNGEETCQQGSCRPGQPLDCRVANKCVRDSCDPAKGCVYSDLPDGTSCSNGDPCDGEEVCQGGICQPGQALDCDDGNPCTVDSCAPGSGCRHDPGHEGAECGGGLCGPAVCSLGNCLPLIESLCDDGNPCTADACDPESGCRHPLRPDGFACGQCRMCLEGACQPAPDCQAGCGCTAAEPTAKWGMGILALLVFLPVAWHRRRSKYMRRQNVMLVLVFSLALSVPQSSRAAEPFLQQVEKVVPLLQQAADLQLLTAGRPEARVERAAKLIAGLPPVAALDPLQQSGQLLNWISALAMVESALRDTDKASTKWLQLELKLYRELAEGESGYRVVARLGNIWALQPGGEQHLLVQMGRQLEALAGYCRRGVRWLAARHLAASSTGEFRRQLLEALVAVERRDGNWQQMYQAALAWGDETDSPKCRAWQAEALYELGQAAQADGLLAGLADKASADVKRARLRGRLYRARHDLQSRGVAAMRELVEVLVELGENWRLTALLPMQQVVAAADAELDELYLDAWFGDGIDYRGAWKFAVQARGRPFRPGFLSRRIAAGLMVLMEQFYGSHTLPAQQLELVERDLEAFRSSQPLLADLTAMNLAIIGYAVAERQEPARLARLARRVEEFRQHHPEQLAGVQALFLLAQLGAKVADPFAVVKQWLAQSGGKLAPEAVAVAGGAALRRLLIAGDTKAVVEAISWLEAAPEAGSSARLWVAHLKAARGLVAPERQRQESLQEAVDAYGAFIQSLEGSPATASGMVDLCDGLVSLATLIMQGGQTTQALQLLEQGLPACKSYGVVRGARAVMQLAAMPAGQEVRKPLAALAAALPRMVSRQTRVQALLWLALSMAANDDSRAARESAQQAQALIEEGRRLGTPLYLAPDLRSLIGFSGSFDINMGYSSASPFGLEIDVGIRCRAHLFPPAAVDEKRLRQLLGKK